MGIVLTHGAGSNLDAPVLTAVAESFAAAGWLALRCNMAYREAGKSGAPHPSNQARDRDSLRQAVEYARTLAGGKVCLGGHSYGGRQSSILLAEAPDLAAGLLLMSYPLHPPGKPEQLRTSHFPQLRTPTLFVHGSRDPFGSIAELGTAVQNITAPVALVTLEGAGHDLRRYRQVDLPEPADEQLQTMLKGLSAWLTA